MAVTVPVQTPRRMLNDHKVNGCNDAIEVMVMDDPGAGGACHEYAITYPTPGSYETRDVVDIKFQNGPARTAHTNGVTNEALLAILADRMRGFQSGAYATIENQIALDHILAAQATLKFRTDMRQRRNVEGTHIP